MSFARTRRALRGVSLLFADLELGDGGSLGRLLVGGEQMFGVTASLFP
jgi:hypothetical protein